VGQTGEWLEIGRITENAEQQREGVTSYRSHGEQQQILYLKIELSN
jgi:lipocalin